MKLDLRRPTLVLAGAWNPVIFKPAWVAQHVFGVPAGVELTVAAVQQSDSEQKLVMYMSGVGFSVSSHRLELFAVDANKSSFEAVENAIAKIVGLLPHTPISAYGINFYFNEESPSPDLLTKIKSYDGLEEHFDIVEDTITSKINLDLQAQMNIQRKRGESQLSFNFNFHRSVIDPDGLIQSIRGEIQSRLAQALSVMRDVYGLSSYEVQKHEFDSTPGE